MAGACPPQRPQDCRQYGPAVMKAASHLPNMACSHMTHLAVDLYQTTVSNKSVQKQYTDQYEKMFLTQGQWECRPRLHGSTKNSAALVGGVVCKVYSSTLRFGLQIVG